MLTIILMFVVAYATNKLTRLYCVFKYKNDIRFIKTIMQDEVIYNLKKDTFDVDQYLKEVMEND